MTEIQGLESIMQRIEDIADKDKIKAAMGKCCALVERTAKQTANSFRDTGTLTNSIQSEVQDDGEDVKGVVFSPLEYAPYVEYGTGLFAEENGRKTPWLYEDEKTGETIFTRGQRPHPYLRPALFENREKITKLLEESVRK
jgi:HK97 gp10 family phage protein